MKIDELLLSPKDFSLIDFLNENCSQFIYQSNGFPLLKYLSSSYKDFQKVKVRKRKKDDVAEHFNDAFSKKVHHLRQRAVFANGLKSLGEGVANEEKFYVFPINGYRFLYQKSIQNSKEEFKESFNTILDSMGNKQGSKVITSMLRFSYVDNENLEEGIKEGAEIIIYNIPYFYAIRESTIRDYKDFYKDLCKHKDK